MTDNKTIGGHYFMGFGFKVAHKDDGSVRIVSPNDDLRPGEIEVPNVVDITVEIKPSQLVKATITLLPTELAVDGALPQYEWLPLPKPSLRQRLKVFYYQWKYRLRRWLKEAP